MARLRSTFAHFVTAGVLGAHLVLLPAVYFGVGYVIRTSHEELFVQHARTFARVLADEFEVGDGLESTERTTDLLDLAVIHGEARFAQLQNGDRMTRSELGSAAITAPRRTDLGFMHGRDDIYFVILPILHAGHGAELRLGFDERPTLERIQLALNRMLMMLTGYLCVVIAAASYLSDRLSRPIRLLQGVARSIASGNYGQTLAVSTAITELHQLSTDLEAMRRELVGVNERLQEKIREKETSEMRRDELQKQLRHRQRLETVGTLAGGIAHEFNNVLVPIILFTEMALKDLPGDSLSHSDLGRVLASARRAKKIVQKILTFSHGVGDTVLEPIDLRGLVGECVVLFRSLVPPGIAIRTDIDPGVARVQADAALAMDLIMNLCTNAYQSIDGGEGVVTVGLRMSRAEDSDSARVELSVRDTGHGMDPATVERIFEPFFTTRPVGQGTGLGLSVAHGIIESFGATVSVDTTLGAGTTFKISFAAIVERPTLVETPAV